MNKKLFYKKYNIDLNDNRGKTQLLVVACGSERLYFRSCDFDGYQSWIEKQTKEEVRRLKKYIIKKKDLK